MYSKAFLAILTVAPLIFLAGCGGGGEAPEGGNGGGGGNGDGQAAQNGDGVEGSDAEVQTANGVVQFANAENRRVFLLPEEEGGEARASIVSGDSTIQLDGEIVELSDIERGQRAVIRFTVNEYPETSNVAFSTAATTGVHTPLLASASFASDLAKSPRSTNALNMPNGPCLPCFR